MNAQEIKNRIDSISNYGNRHIKNSALNLCDAMLKSKFLKKSTKKEVEKIKAEIGNIKDPWLWNDKPDLMNLREIQNYINDLYEIVE